MSKTLSEYIKELPDDEARNEFKANLCLTLKKGIDSVKGYISGMSKVPDEVRLKINAFAKSELDYDRANLEYKERRMNRDGITILKARKHSATA